MVRRQSLERIRIGQASSLSLSEDFTLSLASASAAT
jgi:hypothetical protein